MFLLMHDFECDTNKRMPNFREHGIDFPSWVIDSLDREASRISVTRQAIIKLWLV